MSTSGVIPSWKEERKGNGTAIIEKSVANIEADYNISQEKDTSSITNSVKTNDHSENCKCTQSSEESIRKENFMNESNSSSGHRTMSESQEDVNLSLNPIHVNSLADSKSCDDELDSSGLHESEGKGTKLGVVVDQFTNKLLRESINTAIHCEEVNPFYEGTDHFEGLLETIPSPSKHLARCRSHSESVESNTSELSEGGLSFETLKRFSVPDVLVCDQTALQRIPVTSQNVQDIDSVKDIPGNSVSEVQESLGKSSSQHLKEEGKSEIRNQGNLQPNAEEKMPEESSHQVSSESVKQNQRSGGKDELLEKSSPQNLKENREIGQNDPGTFEPNAEEEMLVKSRHQQLIVDESVTDKEGKNDIHSQNETSDGLTQPMPKNDDSNHLQRPSSIQISADIDQIHRNTSPEDDSPDLMRMSSEDGSTMGLEPCSEALPTVEQEEEELPQRQLWGDERKVTWKVGYLHVKLPHKARGKGHLKAWKRRRVVLQPDEFGSGPSLVLGVYGNKDKHALFWQSVSGAAALVYRSSSSSRSYAFTVAERGRPLLHMAADSETESQEWMAAARAMLWPPSPVIQLQKMLLSEFEVSLVETDFAVRAGLMGAYGLLQVTPRKLILSHPHHGHVVQEWYLSTVDSFRLLKQDRSEDKHRVVAMTTCSDSSTGSGELLFYCVEAVALLQAVAATIHRALQSRQESGGSYQKELQQIEVWLEPDTTGPQPQLTRQVHSLLDIPKLALDAAADISAPSRTLTAVRPSLTSEDLLCSLDSLDARAAKASDSELSDSYTPPRTPPPVAP